MFEHVKKAIDNWNPYSLLLHAPSNEFDSESRQIASRISKDDDIDKIALIVSEVFTRMFGEPQYFDKEKCLCVAEEIKKALLM